MNDRYINLEDLLVWSDAEMEYAKLVGDFDKVKFLSAFREQIDKMPYIEVPQPTPTTTTIYYMHTGERE